MTAEVLVMNRNGIALAADSAGTISDETEFEKIYNSANKLFSLSKRHPVAIMVYGSASIMGIPWETIIKEYRRELGDTNFSTVEEYSQNFRTYLQERACDQESYSSYVRQQSNILISSVLLEIDEKIEGIIEEEGDITIDQIQELHKEAIDRNYRNIKSVQRSAKIKTSQIKPSIDRYRQEINDLYSRLAGARPILPQQKRKIIESAILFSIFHPGLSKSGIVIAGFGEDEKFPHAIAWEITKIMDGVVSSDKTYDQKITIDVSAALKAFAQRNEVASFMNGLSIRFFNFLTNDLGNVFTSDFGDKIATALAEDGEVDPKKLDSIGKKITTVGQNIFESISTQIIDISQKEFSNPVLEAVRFFTPIEMANMAETLVNLESFRKQVTLRSETVGGPIDVAVITKGDGFIWIKRKHYFQPELNHQFFYNYNQRKENDENEDN